MWRKAPDGWYRTWSDGTVSLIRYNAVAGTYATALTWQRVTATGRRGVLRVRRPLGVKDSQWAASMRHTRGLARRGR